MTKQLAAEEATDLDLDDKAALSELQAELDEATDKVEAGEAALSPQRKRARGKGGHRGRGRGRGSNEARTAEKKEATPAAIPLMNAEEAEEVEEGEVSQGGKGKKEKQESKDKDRVGKKERKQTRDRPNKRNATRSC